MVMERVHGLTLHGLLRSGASQSPKQVFEIGRQIAQAMHAVHKAGMVHRDLKPSNLMLAEGLAIKILDFGLVRPLKQGGSRTEGSGRAFSGTVSYAPPELLTRGISGVRGDIYSLGVVLFEMLTGTYAFEGDTHFAIMVNITEGRLATPWSHLIHLPQSGVELIREMMSLDRDTRPARMDQVERALSEAASQMT